MINDVAERAICKVTVAAVLTFRFVLRHGRLVVRGSSGPLDGMRA